MAELSTKQQIIKAQAQTINHLMWKVKDAAFEADKSASTGDSNVAISYLMEIAPLAESIKALADSTITIHQTMKEKE